MSREQGAPKGGRGAPANAGDLTPEAAMSGRRPCTVGRRSHPHRKDGAPAPRRRPLPLAGMRPAAIVAGRRRRGGGCLMQVKEAEK
jgi:hypothetical protein